MNVLGANLDGFIDNIKNTALRTKEKKTMKGRKKKEKSKYKSQIQTQKEMNFTEKKICRTIKE